MNATDRCLEQIEDIRAAARDPRAAYLIRSRLQRLVLSCERLEARRRGAQPPLFPGYGNGLDDPLPRLSREIRETAAKLCQPSESFDVRWERGWAALAPLLDALQTELRREGARRIPI